MTITSFRTFLSPQKEICTPYVITHHFPPPQALATTNLLSMDLPILDICHKANVALISTLFLFMDEYRLHGCTTFCLSVDLLMNVWVISTFW